MIAILALYYLVDVLNNKANELNFSQVKTTLYANLLLCTLVFILMLLNWFLEVFKWKLMITKLQQISFIDAAKSISFGITLALITPNGVGDFGGRLLYVAKKKRWQALYFDSFLSLAQLLITIVLGMLGGCYYLIEVGDLSFMSYLIKYGAFLLSILFVILFFTYKVKDTLNNYLFKKFKGKVVLEIDKKTRMQALLLSLSRYFVFSTQFYILIWIFDSSITLSAAFIGISTIYFVTSVLPTGWISDLAVRTSVAYYIFDSMSYSGEAALLASSLLWIINLFIPGVLGLYNLRRLNWMYLKQELKQW